MTNNSQKCGESGWRVTSKNRTPCLGTSLGTKTPLKLGDVVLISNLELGLERGRYTTGLVDKINKRRIEVTDDMDEVRSVVVKYIKNGKTQFVIKSMYNIIHLDIVDQDSLTKSDE